MGLVNLFLAIIWITGSGSLSSRWTAAEPSGRIFPHVMYVQEHRMIRYGLAQSSVLNLFLPAASMTTPSGDIGQRTPTVFTRIYTYHFVVWRFYLSCRI